MKIKRKWKMLLLVLFVSMAYINFGLEESENDTVQQTKIVATQTVVIDAGHGGYDSGAIAIDGTYEKDINLEIALQVGKQLEEAGIDVIYIREDDDVAFAEEDNITDLRYRVNFAKQNKADLYLSIHCNSSDYGYYRGIEAWANSTSEQSITLSENIMDYLNQIGYSDNRGVADGLDSLYVVGSNSTPSSLIEIGFIDNAYDYSFIGSIEGKKAIEKAIADATIKTLKEG